MQQERTISSAFRFKKKPGDFEINPKSINFVQYPEFFISRGSPFLNPKTGNWDKVIEGKIFWSSKYESLENEDLGMIDIDNYLFLSALKDRFNNGVSWEDTEWLKFIRRHGRIKRYESDSNIAKRISFLEKLHYEFSNGIYVSDTNDLPLVNIGRNGRISMDDGRHRICSAIAANAKKIRVRVKYYHPDSMFTWPYD